MASGPAISVVPANEANWEAILEELHVGTEGLSADAGFTALSRPTPRRAVMRIDF